MEKNKTILINIVLIAFVILLGVQIYTQIFTNQLPIAVDLNLYTLLDRNLTSTHNSINLLYNSFHSWKFDPVIRQLLKVFPEQTLVLLFGYHLFFFACGLFFFLDLISNEKSTGILRQLTIALSTGLIIFCLTLIWQIDLILLSSITWLPYYLIATVLLFQKKLLGAPLSIIFAVLVSISAGQFSILYLSFFTFLQYLIFSTQSPGVLGKIYQKKFYLLIFLIFIIASYFQFQIEVADTPAYPGSARVVSNDPMPGNSRPIFGPNNVLESQDRVLQHEIFKPIILALIALVLIAGFKTRAVWMLSLIGILSLADFFLPPWIAHIMPLQTIARLVPHCLTIPLLPYLILCLTLGGLIFIVYRHGLAVGLIFLVSVSIVRNVHTSTRFHAIAKAHAELDSPYLVKHLQLLNSPSAGIILDNVDSQLKLKPKKPQAEFKSIKNITSEVKASHNSNEIRLAVDDDLNTRWSSKLPGQSGEEKIVIRFRQTKALRGIELDLGKHYTDYPRGLRLSYSETCNDLNTSDIKVLADKPDWPGSPKITPEGFLYYDHQSHIKLFFPTIKVQCLIIEQTETVQHWEFSIAEIKVLLSKKKSLKLRN